MAHIQLPEGLPGIRGPLVFSPATTPPLCDFVEALLRGPSTLTLAEREMIATYVSAQNDCYYCQASHGSTAAQHLGGGSADYELIGQMKRDCETAPISEKMKALLAIAGKVQKGGKFNRYVDGLDTWQPRDLELYVEIGRQAAALGYAGRDWKRLLPTAASK